VSLNSLGNRGPFGGWLSRLDVGVAVFFVLSGYLLYRPFARSVLRDDEGLDLRRYLRHRLLRIVPAYWLVVVVSFLFAPSAGGPNPTSAFSPAASGATSVPLSVMARFLTFTQVYWKDSLAGPFPQAWTLATEMAFYLFLPLVFVVLRRRTGRSGTRAQRLRRQWLLLGGMVAVAQLYRLGVVLLDPAYDGPANAYTQLKAWLPNHLDLFAAGMAFAVLSVEREDGGPGAGIGDRLDRWFSRRGAAGLSFLVAFGALTLGGYGLGLSRTALTYGRFGEFTRHWSFVAIAVALVLPALFGRSAGGPVRAILSSPPMQFLGRISYGIYLWQLVVIGRWVSAPSYTGGTPAPARHAGQQFHVAFWPTLAWTLALTIALATVTWYLVERPWLARKDRPIGWFAGGMWAIALASFASRVAAFGTATARNPGNGDPFYYHAQANMLADGLGFGQPIEWLTNGRFVATAIHPPLFTLWLTPASLVGARGFLSHKVLAALAGVGVVVVAGLLARRLAGPRAGLLAAGLAALYPDLWVIDGTLWPEGLYTLAVGLALLAAYRWRDRPTFGRAALVGAGVGAAILTRGEALLLLPMLCLPLAWSGRKVAARWALHGVVMAVVALGLLAPWTIRNLMTFDRPVPVSTNSEEVLYYANCPDAYAGPLIGYWSFGCQQRARQARVDRGLPPDPPGDEAERSAAWGRLGRRYALDHKDRWPAVVTARLTRMWDVQHSDNNVAALAIEGRPHDWGERGLWIYRLVLVPGLIGLYVARRRGVAVWPLVSMIAMVTLTAVYAYGHVRFRTVADLVLVVGAAVAVDALLPGRPRAAADDVVAGSDGGPDSDGPPAADQPGPPGDVRPLETGAR
jgi:peptidoglycan/LPS O-acetylase OafA/YrhL